MYVGEWLPHESRYARSREFVDILHGLWREPRFSYEGAHYAVRGAVLSPKPSQRNFEGAHAVPIYAGGESEEARAWIAARCDGYLLHGDREEAIASAIADMDARRAERDAPRLAYGMAAYMVCRSSDDEARSEVARITDVRASSKAQHSYADFVAQSKLRSPVTLEDYSVSNRGLRPDLVGTPRRVIDRIKRYEDLGVELLLLQASPMAEEIERIGNEVLPYV